MCFPHLTDQFVEWAKGVCEKIITSGYFADYLDPASGLPVCIRL